MTTTLEDRLRDAYKAAARTVRPETIRPGVRYPPESARRSRSRSRRRFSVFAPVAAAAAVVAAIATAVTVPHLVSGGSPSAVGTAPATITSTPPFIVELAGARGKIAVQQTGTKHVKALIPLPGGAVSWEGVAATSDTTFIAAASTTSGRAYTSALYQFTISAKGQPGQLTRLLSGIPGEITALTASQDDHRIAYVTLPANGTKATISVTTGSLTRDWTVAGAANPGDTGLLTSTLAFTADGSELGFIMFRIADTVGPVRAAGTMWLLPVDSASGSATARGHKVTTGPHDSAPFSAVLSGDGETMYVLSTPTALPDSGHTAPQSVILSAYSTVDGALLRTIHTWTHVSAGGANSPSMTISRGGGQLLVWGVGGTAAYQVDPVSGAVKPTWLYSLQDESMVVDSSSVAW